MGLNYSLANPAYDALLASKQTECEGPHKILAEAGVVSARPAVMSIMFYSSKNLVSRVSRLEGKPAGEQHLTHYIYNGEVRRPWFPSSGARRPLSL